MLTDADIIAIRKATKPEGYDCPWADTIEFARAIERAARKEADKGPYPLDRDPINASAPPVIINCPVCGRVAERLAAACAHCRVPLQTV